jgi:hypothetical protein
MVVIAIVGLVMGGAVIALGALTGSKAKKTTIELAGTIRSLYDSAALTGKTCRLVFDLPGPKEDDGAVKYRAEGSRVDLFSRADAESVLVEVHNSGEPIPGEVLPYLFEPFRRGVHPSEPLVKMSLGLGLYIVQEIVRAHGGSTEVRSSAKEGTSFRVRLPRQPKA